jgi:oxygen-independent coproporphyrinogen-3 oxidase
MGYIQYEISNFARMGFVSRHNQGYWDRLDYLGMGPSAVSTLGNRRFTNPEFMDAYDAAVRGKFLGEDYEELTPEVRAEELVMLSLRTARGLKLLEHKKLTGRDLIAEKKGIITALHKNGLIKMSAGFLRLTKNGMLVSNSIIQSLAFD